MNNKQDFNHSMETEQANILQEEVRVNDSHEEHKVNEEVDDGAA